MSEILLVRHAKAYANVRDFTVFGNRESPLNEQGIEQASALADLFREQLGISPKDYEQAVMASEYTRPQQTAQQAGFRFIDVDGIINESEVEREAVAGTDIVLKHARERWVPDETRERAARLVDLIRRGHLTYQIYFTHGLFIAGTLLHLAAEAEATGQAFPYEFKEKRGYIPSLATITLVSV